MPGDDTKLEFQAQPPKVRFRNYYPKTPVLQAGVQQRLTTSEIEAQIDAILAANQEALDKKEWMAPTASKKNWDIKRDFQRKLATLERKTEQAMVKLIRKQILESQGRAAVATAAASASAASGASAGAVGVGASGGGGSSSSRGRAGSLEEDEGAVAARTSVMGQQGGSSEGGGEQGAPVAGELDPGDGSSDGGDADRAARASSLTKDVVSGTEDGDRAAMREIGRQLAEMKDHEDMLSDSE